MGSEAERIRGLTDEELLREIGECNPTHAAELASRLKKLKDEGDQLWHSLHPEEMRG